MYNQAINYRKKHFAIDLDTPRGKVCYVVFTYLIALGIVLVPMGLLVNLYRLLFVCRFGFITDCVICSAPTNYIFWLDSSAIAFLGKASE
jgi:hypothetical protein